MAKSAVAGEEERIPGLGLAFGDVLRTHRLAAKLSQERVALEVGLDRTFLSLLERGRRRPSLATIFMLARYFGIEPSDLVREVEERMKSGG